MILDAFKDILLNAHDLLVLDGAGIFVSFLGLIWLSIRSLLYGIFYAFSFQWLWDFVEIPSLFKHHYMSILGGQNAIQNLDNTSTVIFSEVRLNSQGILTGLCNSFFLAIPVTVPQLITLRAFLLGDYRRAAVCAAGTIGGQSLLFALVLFGFEWLLIPFVRLEPLFLIIGTVILCNYLTEMCQKSRAVIVTNRDPTKLIDSFRLTFSLACLETSCIFHYFGGLTVHNDLLQTSEGTQWYLISTLAYFLALLIGSILWTGLFGLVLHHVRRFCLYVVLYRTALLTIYGRIHAGLTLLIGVSVCHSIPYYGVDYLVSNPFGFLYADAALVDVQPKTFYNQTAVDIDELNLDSKRITIEDDDETVLDVAAFDDEVTETQARSGFEPTSFAPEIAWENRYEARARVDEKAARKAFEAIFKRDILHFDQSLFFSPELTQEDIADDEIRYDMLDDMASAVFRWDIYNHISNRDEDPDFEFETQTHHVFRDRYLSNPVYKALVKGDMLTFLMGQPASANLNIQEEFDLSQRRYILQHYLDFLANFKQVNTFDNCFFPTDIYNQQFKGTLHVVRQYNAVRLSFPEMDTEFDILMQPTPYPDQPDTKPLTYDMPLYNRYHDQYQDYLHEELRPYIRTPLWKRLADKGNGEKRPLKNDLDNELRLKKNKIKTKQLRNQVKKTNKDNKRNSKAKQNKRNQKPKKLTKAQQIKLAKIQQRQQRLNRAIGRKLRHMTSNDTRPFYIGWDSDKQKVLIQSPVLPTGLTPQLQPDEVSQFHIQAWPEWPDQDSTLWLQQLNLPQFVVPDLEIKKIRSTLNYYDFQAAKEMKELGMTEDEEMLDTYAEKKQFRFNADLRLRAEKQFFKRLSNYDWFWHRLYLMDGDEDEDQLKAQHLKLGNVLPPGLDGTAWPLMKDNRIWQNDQDRYEYP